MEVFELILVLLACVMVSSIMDQMISRMSLPLLQIGVGLVFAVLFQELANVHVDSELFLMLQRDFWMRQTHFRIRLLPRK